MELTIGTQNTQKEKISVNQNSQVGVPEGDKTSFLEGRQNVSRLERQRTFQMKRIKKAELNKEKATSDSRGSEKIGLFTAEGSR